MAILNVLVLCLFSFLTLWSFLVLHLFSQFGIVKTGLPVGVGIGSLPVTPNRNGEIGVLCVESGLAGVPQHNKNMINEMNE